ncbi:uncharacterized protein METZ01_LOCUS321376, partial [marine metagenome]
MSGFIASNGRAAPSTWNLASSIWNRSRP